MTRLPCSLMLVGLLMLGGARGLPAQDLGPILDWIHKLSGPPFVGAGLTGSITVGQEPRFLLRLTGVYRTSVSESDAVDPDDANITMITLQPTVELPLETIPFDFGIGVALHRFGGDADGFWHYSVPVLVQWRPRNASRLIPRIGLALHVFPEFDATDFAPLTVDVSRDGAEAVLQSFVSLAIRF